VSRPLVSVITPTWGRPNLLQETVEHVRKQTYPNIEHVIVFDGPGGGHWSRPPEDYVREVDSGVFIRIFDLGWRPTVELRDSFAVGALTVGALMARGEYQMWLCDDERMAPDHIEALVDLLETTGVDFVYPLVYLWKAGNPDHGIRVGVYPPQFGTITSVLYRRSCLDKGMYRFHIPRVPGAAMAAHDWDLISQWLENGATCALLSRETLSHREDH